MIAGPRVAAVRVLPRSSERVLLGLVPYHAGLLSLPAVQIKEQSLVRTQSYIGGQWCDASDGATWEVRSPATAELLARVSHCRGRETTAAVAEAEAAFPSWAALTGKQRGDVLRRWHDLVREHEDDIATLMTLECGKPLSESRGEFQSGLASIEWFAEEAKRVQGDVLPVADSQRRFFALRQPVGVVGAVTPWNFPFSMITRKVSPALAAGCSVVLKPSELTPLTAL
ncbi:aldehyde dehydrogenase, partial [Helicosporidium sp. ATCC 50920]